MQAIEKCCIKAVCLLLIQERLRKADLGAWETSGGPSASLQTCSLSSPSSFCLNSFDSYTKALLFFFFLLALRTFKAININFSDPNNIKLIYNFLLIQNEVAVTDTHDLIFWSYGHTYMLQINKPRLQKYCSYQSLCYLTTNQTTWLHSGGTSFEGWEEERLTVVPIIYDEGISQQLHGDNHSSC